MTTFIVSRHGERADYAYDDPTKKWYEACAVSIPAFNPVIMELLDDAMLTESGADFARHVGSSLANHTPRIDAIYSSPALRCVQTASIYAEFFNVKVNVEPGLFEPVAYLPRPPTVRWRTIPELARAGLRVNEAYTPHSPAAPNTGAVDTATAEYLSRTAIILAHLQRIHAGGTVLLVGHASSHFSIPLMLAAPQLCEPTITNHCISHQHAFFGAVLSGENLNNVPLCGIIRCVGRVGEWRLDTPFGQSVRDGATARASVAPTGFITLGGAMRGSEKYFGHALGMAGNGSIVFTARGFETLRVVVNSSPTCSRGGDGTDGDGSGAAVYCFVIGESQGFIRRSNRGGDVSLAHSSAVGTCLSSRWRQYWVSLDASRGVVAMGEGQPHRSTTLLVALDAQYLKDVRYVGFANWTKAVEIKEVYIGPPPSGLPDGWLGSEHRAAADAAREGTNL